MNYAKTIIRINILLACLILSGCCLFSDNKLTESVHEYNLPAPLELNNVEWSVIEHNGYNYYSLDSRNFSNLSLNMQEVQDRLYLYQTMLETQNKSVDSLEK